MSPLVLVLLVAAAILSGLATFGVGARWNLLAAAFCCFVLSVLLPGLGVG
jgi:hypothetical protein